MELEETKWVKLSGEGGVVITAEGLSYRKIQGTMGKGDREGE